MTTDPRAVIVAGASLLLIGVTATVYTVLTEHPARDTVANVRRPSAQPGTPVRPEYAPPVPASIPGDGVFVVGKTVKAGSYRTAGAPRCTWARLNDLKSTPSSVRDRGPAPSRTQVDLVDGVIGFATYGCPEWVMVR